MSSLRNNKKNDSLEDLTNGERQGVELFRAIKFKTLKELSHEIEMGCLWYGWKEPYLEMNL